MGQIITVNFRNDTLFAVERDDGVFVAVKPICDSFPVAWQSQHQRLKDDPVLSEGITTIVMPSPGGAQETVCLKLEMVNGWLFKIDSRRVQSEEGRQKLIVYQRECYQVLFDHFYGKRTKVAPQIADEPQENETLNLRKVTECRHVFGNQAAAQLWMKLGLDMVPAMLHDPRQITLFDYAAVKSHSEAV